MVYMPGKRSVPNASEKYPFFCSSKHCFRMKVACLSSVGIGRDSSCVIGKDSHKESAQGQNPSRRPVQIDFTKRGFGWFFNKDSNMSTLIGDRTWNRLG